MMWVYFTETGLFRVEDLQDVDHGMASEDHPLHPLSWVRLQKTALQKYKKTEVSSRSVLC